MEKELRSSLHLALSKFVNPETYVKGNEVLPGGYKIGTGSSMVEWNRYVYNRYEMKYLRLISLFSTKSSLSGCVILAFFRHTRIIRNITSLIIHPVTV